MHEHITNQLSRYLDGELPPAERRELERHLGGCDECRRVRAQLQGVTAWAPTYQGMPPSQDLWRGIESRLGTRPISTAPSSTWHRRRVSVRAPLLAAAAIILIVFGAGLMWLLRPTSAPQVAQPTRAIREFDVTLANSTNQQYDAAVRELEAILASSDTALDPETLRVIRQSLATIDKAIDDARGAIAQDSTNDFLNASIRQNMQRKLEILRTATLAATAKT